MTPHAIPLLDGDTLMIDNSSMEPFVTCPRLAQYTILNRLRPAGDKWALIFGGIIHKILEVRYRALTTLHAQTPDVTSVMLATAEREFAKVQTPEDEFRNYSCAVEFIRRYEEQYPFESFEVLRLTDGTPLIEFPFALPLGEIDVNADMLVRDVKTDIIAPRFVKTIKLVWMGRVDMAYRSSNGGGAYGMDHKTTSIMGPSFGDQFILSHQLHGYAWALEQLIGEPVAAVVVNGLGVRKPTKTGKAFEFVRPVVNIRRALLEEWKTDTLHIIADFIEMARRGYMPKHTVWCTGKFGLCSFHKVCTLDSEEQRKVMLESGEYQRNTWSPLK